MKRTIVSLALLAVLMVFSVAPAFAVTDGTKDGDGHPEVVLLVMDVDGAPAFRCSATLLSPTVVLTAGHCTSNYPDTPYTGMRVFTETDVDNGDNSYPFCGKNDPNCFEAKEWHAHPQYETAPFYVHDVGVVILKKPIILDEYGALPSVNQFDSLETQRGQQDKTFTAVGYGLQQSFPDAASWKTQADRIRYVANPYLIQINGGIVGDFSFLLSNNAYSGGTCFGDSGGPNFWGSGPDETNIVAGVTSFGMNGNCAGTGGVFRMDRQNVLDFVGAYLSAGSTSHGKGHK